MLNSRQVAIIVTPSYFLLTQEYIQGEKLSKAELIFFN
ncbi:hypothetical protein P20652_4051 [Pseudoalteromonas sp. BSi20652]|nr:hypothetical protein P20652_4051 [Pseudoalteromonas sp. BSi20652]